MTIQDLNALTPSLPSVTGVISNIATALLVAGAVFGLVLWALGCKFAKPVCAAIGTAAGAMAGGLVARSAGYGDMALLGSFVGSIAGVFVALLLFRVWMSLALAVVLAAAMAVGVLLWSQGMDAASPFTAPGTTVQRVVNNQINAFHEAPAATDGATLRYKAESLAKQARQDAQSWWDHLGAARRSAVMTWAVVGAIVGLGIGLMRPMLAASIQTALVASVLFLLLAPPLVRTLAPAQASWLPRGPQTAVLAIGLITIVGVLVQCALTRRPADKSLEALLRQA